MTINKYLIRCDIQLRNSAGSTHYEALLVESGKSLEVISGQLQCETYTADSPYNLGMMLGSKVDRFSADEYFDDRLPNGLAPIIIQGVGSIVRYTPLSSNPEDETELSKGILETLV